MSLKFKRVLLNAKQHLSSSALQDVMQILIICLIIDAVIFTVTAGYTLYHLGNTILPGVHVHDINVGGLTINEATTVLTQALPKPDTLGVDVKVGGRTWPISWADVGQHYNIHATVQSAYNVGRDATERPPLLMRLREQNAVITPVIAPADPELVQAYITQIATAVQVDPVDAHFEIDDGDIIATSGHQGHYLDLKTSRTRLFQALTKGIPTVKLELLPVSPKIPEPEPARTQAQRWLSKPFTLVVNNSLDDASTGDVQTKFVAPLETVSTWFEPHIADQDIELHISNAPIETWLEEIAPKLGPTRPLNITETRQGVRTALYAGEHQAQAHLRLVGGMYTIQLGDTLLSIALEFNTTVEELKASNNLKSDTIIVGQRLLIPSTLPTETQVEAAIEDYESPTAPPPLLPASHTEDWQEDLTTLIDELTKLAETKEDRFSVIYDESFTQAVEALQTAIPTLADHQIVIGIMRIMALFQDAHTGVTLYRWNAFEESAYPIKLQWFRDGLFVKAAQPGYEELIALELVQIGSVPISEVMVQLAKIIPHENTYGLYASSTEYMSKPVILHALGLTTNLTRAAFVFKPKEERTLTRYLVADSPATMQDKWILPMAQETIPLYLQKSEDTYYWYTYIESSRAIYLQFNLCAEDPEIPLTELLDEISGIIATQPAEKYIIDLRHNTGGSPGPPGLIINHLKAHPQFTQNNNLYVLIGNNTFSSGVYLTSMLQRQFGATLIGEPTGQGANFYASPKTLTLPNSGLAIHYSLAYWEFAEMTSETITPNIRIPLSSTDYFTGLDPVLNKALAQP